MKTQAFKERLDKFWSHQAVKFDLTGIGNRSEEIIKYIVFSARCNISRAYATMSVSVCLSVCVTEVHWRIIANLGFKFRSHFTAHCGRLTASSTVAVLLAVLLAGGSARAMLASARSLVTICFDNILIRT